MMAFGMQCTCGCLFGQINQTVFYKVKDGLPSNSIYKVITDKKGFLWVATDMGLSRFDGKKFRNYSNADGLTDNDITNIIMDSSGIVWVMPFRRKPCYYNEVEDRFESEETNSQLASVKLGIPALFPLKTSGVLITDAQCRLLLFRNDKLVNISHPLAIYPTILYKIVECKANKFLLFSADTIRSFNNGQLKNILPVNSNIIAMECVGNKLYMASINSIKIFQFNESGQVKFIAEKKYSFEIRIFCYTGKRFSITSLNGTTYMLDGLSLKPIEIVSAAEGMSVRNVMEDNTNNIWLSTIDKGLVKVQRKRISSFDLHKLKQNFNTIIKTTNIITGNNNGEIFKFDGLYTKKLQLNKDKNIDAWVRKIIMTSQGVYVASQSGSFLVDEKSFTVKKAFKPYNRSSKGACLLNDSILLLGSHAFAFKYNLLTNKVTDSVRKRVVSIGADLKSNIYIGSTEGLFLWKEKNIVAIEESRKGFSYKINAIACSPDNLMWIGLGADSLMVLYNNKCVACIALGDVIPGNMCKSLYCNKRGEIWLGTNKGLNRLLYSFDGKQLQYTNAYFGMADGLIGEQVNDITIQDDTVYVATNEGISYLPAGLQLPVYDIATYITSVRVNNLPVPLRKSYELAYDENDITINFSGVDLTGFIPPFEYSINESKWQHTDKIELKKLASGIYTIKVRAIRRDGKPSIQQNAVMLQIAFPFWRNSFLKAIAVLLIFATVLYLQQRTNKQKQHKAIEKILTEKRITELEMQALKAQINPHFIFNCLNSIKWFIYDRDYKQADKYLDKFAELMRSTIDNSDAALISLKDEIHYLDNYLQLEKLRFDEKFDYSITASPDIDKENVFVPAMLLQPFVENAIRHGIRFLEDKKGSITISTTIKNDLLVCEIDDNGIGRKKAAALKSSQHIEYQSRGMSISKRRADLYLIKQEIVDKNDANGNGCGTKIIIKIPITLKP